MSKDYRFIWVAFQGHAGDDTDAAVTKIIAKHHGEFCEGGAFMGPPMQRDAEYRVLAKELPTVRRKLKRLGNIKVSTRVREFAR